MNAETLPPRPPLMPAEHPTVGSWLASIAEGLRWQAGRDVLVTAREGDAFREIADYVAALEQAAGVRYLAPQQEDAAA